MRPGRSCPRLCVGRRHLLAWLWGIGGMRGRCIAAATTLVVEVAGSVTEAVVALSVVAYPGAALAGPAKASGAEAKLYPWTE